MHRSFAVLSRKLRPELVFLLGDLFDEGQWSNAAQLETYTARLHSLFPVRDGALRWRNRC